MYAKKRSAQPDSSLVVANENEIRENRLPNPAITDYFYETMCNMKNKGYIDDVKNENNMRILSMNIHGYRLEQNELLKVIKDAMTKYQIDISLFNETNTK